MSGKGKEPISSGLSTGSSNNWKVPLSGHPKKMPLPIFLKDLSCRPRTVFHLSIKTDTDFARTLASFLLSSAEASQEIT